MEDFESQLEDQSHSITAMIESVRADKAMIRANLDYLPADVTEKLTSEAFSRASDEKFRECDADGNGVLSAEER